MKYSAKIFIQQNINNVIFLFRKKDRAHRSFGPAIKYVDGTDFWYQNGNKHKVGGPALECFDGAKVWYQNDLRHRLDGPAVEFIYSGKNLWFINGKEYSEEKFNEYILNTKYVYS